ncbi:MULTISPECIES: biotin--[acetyl-CoA-carboxylase] ligase [Streptomyces]|uniref:biotin--[biotin carboxyl-carrier protein] ligase n=2 Tax=Streptomyces nigrescens TaxID=1920 RepID=A0A640TJN9_STRNI|nr:MULTISPECIES: biotin--[acetyl-CoA-carboxylase] ligase [Streptomyces]AWN29186.1 biotin--[acetyl-CoA-carboxylase] ligase [Streptomyces sp. NEAU-S7GS2]MCX5444937.1 biotin--[acetyl-CoA-carboxylase] ligase [Streptomyces libani]MYT11894.1 biotin--[acetyl-CoA-carboxylase] ligase [Streptomyces sp. SID4951]MYX07003.1 biotin--[acetyl-CoA-carboxylase] ligase [Streptomyces sp. SID8375]WAT97013.1 biotin--[acetyl-CoA-carboxylase] ligase [Streptomyces libani subsp. libani]
MTPQPPENRDKDAGRWSDLSRPPLNAAALRRALVRPGALWTALDVVPATGSTNTDLAARVAEGKAEEGAVLVAEEQSAGRGRLNRSWSAPPRSGLFFSVYLTPNVPVQRWGWLPLLAGVATATALSRTAGIDTSLKWPNDILVSCPGDAGAAGPDGTPGTGERKVGGILAERAGSGVVIGIGLNVSLTAGELPVPTAGSLALAGARTTDRDPLLRAVLRSLEEWYATWQSAVGDPGASRLQETYAAGCATLGRSVRAELPGGSDLTGEAVAIDGDGRLVLATANGVRHPVGAGDIIHLRAAASRRADGEDSPER